MISSLNTYGGLTANQLLTLFGANASSSQSSQSTPAAQAGSANADSSAPNDPASSIKAILAQSHIGRTTAGGGWSVTDTVESAYAAQMGDSGFVAASVTFASPGAAQQINQAVATINQWGMMVQRGNVSSPAIVSANDAINFSFSNGCVSVTALSGANLPGNLPSMSSIQQAIAELKSQDEGTGWNGVKATPITQAKQTADAWWNNTINGNFTLVKLPSSDPGIGVGGSGGNVITIGEGGESNWAIVLSQNTVSANLSLTKNEG